ncbi:afadin isoform X5 [Megalobrama amblycephala]|uniref:afadin isoform X5 n=1 Tax=Megalobrama amblycephala TaxID=75352 RepID=UPI00201423BA|nr:afadin isoform X5 [Megalobrama amblycephala]
MGSREEERRKLADIINHWNANRLDLFEISQPTEDLEFHGVMRFYFQDRVAGNFATKCIRVSSTATTQDVIETLAEKFRPDMRMLSSPKYSLYEVHVSGEERKLDLDEKPLVVQLNWNKDDREGRFVLKNENDIMPKRALTNGPEKEKEGVIQNFKRTLSKKEKKKEKKREKEAFSRIPDGDDHTLNREDGENSRLAAEVYKDMPETSFTRTISNPEVVMKRRRQQKLEKRMQEFRSGDGRPDSGGTLRIYADSLKPNIPYKTILLSTTDMADFAVAEALEKYGLEKENPRDYCIAQVIHANDKPVKETILDDTDCPLQILRDWTSDKEALVFQLKKRPPDYVPRKGRKPDTRMGQHGSIPPEKLPYLVELSPGRGSHYAYYYRHHEDGSDSRDKPKLYRLQHSLTEVGSERSEDGSIQLFGPGILPHHCDLMHADGLVTVTPVSLDAETFVDGQRISDTTVLRSGVTVQFGATHVFKFVDPSYDHSMSKRDPGPMMKSRHKSGSVPETTFDLHGDIHSGSALPTSKSSGKLEMERSGNNSERGLVKPMIRGEQQDFSKHDGRSQDGPELTLPASIEFRENSEDAFLSAIINYTNSSTVHFKLSPTYVLYMTCRYVMSSQYRPDISPSERTHKVIAIVNKMVSMMEGVIQEIAEGDQKQKNIAGALAFWMANASELLNFIKQDKDLSRITLDAQDVLAHLVQMAFKYLVHCLQSDLNNYMPAFLEDPDEQNPQRPKIDDVLHTLTGAMSLLRRCRVNAALTIQLFSQLFHFINMWLFNKLVTEADSGLCSHYWGAILRQQLSHIEAWAEKQGLELAADCHLSRIVQATTLLTMDKYSMQDVQNINNTCFKLNSLQLNALLSNYHCAPDEPYIPPELIDHVVAVAENTADELARSDGREVQLEEDPDLQLPFLLPEDGYSCDVVRNIPNGFQEFLEPLCQRGFCRLIPHPRSPGTWTIYFEGADCDSHFSADTSELPMRKEPEIVTVTLKKHNGMGLSIVAAKGAGQDKLGIYIKSVVKGGAADMDGRLAAGDQLLSVDGRSLVGLSQERAAELMTRTGSVVTLEVAKQGAIYHGLATLLNQPSPMMPRGSDRGRGDKGKLRPKSEGFELYNNSVQNGSPESPQGTWDTYPEPKKEDRLLKNRADHRSSPNVANQAQSPGGKPVYPGAPGKITSVSTGNLCPDEEPSPPRPEAYPIPTQTYPREYFTFPASKSQDRMGPGQPWQNNEPEPLPPMDNHSNNSMAMQRVVHSQEELCDMPGGYPGERLRQEDLMHLQQQQREAEYQRGGGEHWNNQTSSSVESSTSSQEHLNFSSSSGSRSQGNHKSGPGRWKTPIVPHSGPVGVSQPSRSDLPPPPPPPPAHYDYEPQPDMPLPPPPSVSQQQAVAAADRKKREEQQRWYEKEKARLEEERERKRRDQERKLVQIRNPAVPGPVMHNNQHGPLPPAPQHQQMPHPQPPMPVQVPQPYLPPVQPPQPPPPQPTRPDKLSSLPRQPPQDTVIRDLLPQQQPRTIERRDLQYITISKEELSASDSLSPDPWKRDAREKLEKQQQLHIVDLLDKEIQELQSKPERTAEENDRLRKLMLEWQFQKRLQESKQNEEDEEEEDDEDVDTTLIMQRLEAEKRARLQDEERRRKQQLEEIRKREAEERVKQEEERRWREEERARRETEEKRRQEEEYYTRLEAERRRQHEEAERKLLTPDEPGLYRPPLPRDYQPPSPASTPTTNNNSAPPPPPQRNTSYLKTQVASPDTIYTAKFVSYNDEEEEEDEEDAGLTGQVKLSATRKSYGDLPPAQKPQPPPTARKPRPVSDGIFLSNSFQLPAAANANSTALKAGQPPLLPNKPSFIPSANSKGFNSYTGNTTGLGSGEVYKDPREKWTKGGPDQENTIGGAPENLTFKERQRLFSQGKEVSNKVKASRKLMELENELNIKQ